MTNRRNANVFFNFVRSLAIANGEQCNNTYELYFAFCWRTCAFLKISVSGRSQADMLDYDAPGLYLHVTMSMSTIEQYSYIMDVA